MNKLIHAKVLLHPIHLFLQDLIYDSKYIEIILHCSLYNQLIQIQTFKISFHYLLFNILQLLLKLKNLDQQ